MTVYKIGRYILVLICLANQTGVDLTEALHKNFERKSLRDAERHMKHIAGIITLISLQTKNVHWK